MNSLHKVLMEITPNAERFQGLASNRFLVRNESPTPNVKHLPYIPNHRETRTRGTQNRSDRLNISMEPNVEAKPYKGSEDIRNSSFQVDAPSGESFYMLNTLRYPKKDAFTKTLLQIQKDKTVFVGGRTNQKQNNDEEEEKLLIRKLEETRAKKENIMRILAENERKQREKEANIEKTQKILNNSVRVIQLQWRLYKERKVLKVLKVKRQIGNMTDVATKTITLFTQLTDRLNQENIKMAHCIGVIQRNARKFLAKRKFKVMWRRKIHDFINQKLINVISKAAKKTVISSLKNYVASQVEASAFFLTCHPGHSLASLGSDFDSISQSKDSRGFYRRKSVRGGEVSDKRPKHIPFVYKRPSFFVHTSAGSYNSIQSTDPDQKIDPMRRFRTKVSRGSMDDQSIGDISETVNPADEISPEKLFQSRKDSIIWPESPSHQTAPKKTSTNIDLDKAIKIKIRGRNNSVNLNAPNTTEAPSRNSVKKGDKGNSKAE